MQFSAEGCVYTKTFTSKGMAVWKCKKFARALCLEPATGVWAPAPLSDGADHVAMQQCMQCIAAMQAAHNHDIVIERSALVVVLMAIDQQPGD
jgi:hypothetical protein